MVSSTPHQLPACHYEPVLSPVTRAVCPLEWARRSQGPDPRREMWDDWRKPFLWFIVISQWGHAPGDTRRPGGWLMICLDNTNNYTECWGRAILQSGKWECVGIPNVQWTCFLPASAHHNSAHLRVLNQNICLETKSLFIVPESPCLSVWGSCLSQVTPSHITCIFSPLPPLYHGAIDS